MKDFIQLLHKIGKLKEIKRKGWVLRNVPDPESVADHSFRTTIMALLLADKLNLNREKCVNMALIHDLGESIVGDITPHDNISKKEKYDLEKKAIQELFKDNDEFIRLWEEYEERKTPEAKFIFELDKIEMLMQAFEYEKKHKDIDLSEFKEYVEERIKDPKIKEILEILKNDSI